jgi:hypothetical protein
MTFIVLMHQLRLSSRSSSTLRLVLRSKSRLLLKCSVVEGTSTNRDQGKDGGQNGVAFRSTSQYIDVTKSPS